MAQEQNLGDQDAGKGAVEGDDRTNSSLRGQNPHRTSNSLVRANDSDFPEPGNNPEHSGEPAEGADIKARRSPEGERVNQDPGHKQKQMHNDEKDDPLAA
jgi:hypothetical protein